MYEILKKLSKSCFEGLKAVAQISALKPTLKIELCFDGWFERTDLRRPF
jgi:hypothetical protein